MGENFLPLESFWAFIFSPIGNLDVNEHTKEESMKDGKVKLKKKKKDPFIKVHKLY